MIKTDREKKIIAGLQAGDENAYQYVYTYHYRALCVLANGYVYDSSAAEMIVSDVIFSIWNNRGSLVIEQSLRNYLTKAVRNRCINYLAVQTRHVSLESVSSEIKEPAEPNAEAQPLSRLIEQELDAEINQCIAGLPPLTRRIFCLSRFENLKYARIAEEMNVSVDVVKYHIKSALSQLREQLKEYLLLLLLLLIS